MKFSLIIFVIISFNCNFCFGQKTYIGNKEKVKLVLMKKITLHQNLQLLGKITDFTVDKDGNIYVLDLQTRSIIKYNSKGVQENVFGRKGRGPFEYLDPTVISDRKDTLYIWDAKLLRFTAIETNGDSLMILNKFPNAVADIRKYNNYLIAYNTGSPFGKIVTIFDLSQKKVVKETGHKTPEHVLLMRLEGSGGLAVKDGIILFCRADKPTIHK